MKNDIWSILTILALACHSTRGASQNRSIFTVPTTCYSGGRCNDQLYAEDEDGCPCQGEEDFLIFENRTDPHVLPNGDAQHVGSCTYRGVSGKSLTRVYRIGAPPNAGPVFTACVDPGRMETHWTMHAHVRTSRVGGPFSDSWDRYPYYANEPSPIDNYYTKRSELEAFNTLLPGTDHGGNYIDPERGQCYLAKGHLTPCADFYSSEERLATYFYINAFPQWQISNNGNWKQIETRLRGSAFPSPLWMSTGTLGTLELERTELYLNLGALGRDRRLPVNAISWKAVYTLDVVFVTVNNPFLAQAPAKICSGTRCNIGSILGELTTGSWTTLHRGYSYCCTIAEFNSATGNAVPPLALYEWEI